MLRKIWQVLLDMQVFLPFLSEAILYLTYIKDLVQVLRKHFRGGWGVQANAYYAYIGGGAWNHGKHAYVILVCSLIQYSTVQ